MAIVRVNWGFRRRPLINLILCFAFLYCITSIFPVTIICILSVFGLMTSRCRQRNCVRLLSSPPITPTTLSFSAVVFCLVFFSFKYHLFYARHHFILLFFFIVSLQLSLFPRILIFSCLSLSIYLSVSFSLSL